MSTEEWEAIFPSTFNVQSAIALYGIGPLQTNEKQKLNKAIRAIVDYVVEKCSAEACATDESYHSMQEGSIIEIDKQSILNVKNLFIYEE